MTMTNANKPRSRVRCQAIASLESRRRDYWREVLSVAVMLLFIAAIAFALCAAAVKFFGAPWLNAALVSAVIMAGPVWMFWPQYPTEDDVERDRELRRSAGMPDEVECD